MGKTDIKICTKIVRLVRKKGDIHLFDLIDELDISINQWNLVKPYLLHRYVEYIRYDKKTRMLINISKDATIHGQEELPVETKDDSRK